MKHIFLVCALFAGIVFSFAGNGNDGNVPCNCQQLDNTDIYAAGMAEMVSSTQVKCSGEEGKCWEVSFKPGGGWVLTIFTEPPQTWGNDNGQDDPPPGPTVVAHGSGYQIYELNPQVWR
jgi:hypothetical protein